MPSYELPKKVGTTKLVQVADHGATTVGAAVEGAVLYDSERNRRAWRRLRDGQPRGRTRRTWAGRHRRRWSWNA